MSDKEEKGKSEMVIREEGKITLPPEKSIRIGSEHIDLTGLTEEQIQALKEKYADGMIEVGIKHAETGVDTKALDRKLDTMAEHTKALAKEGAAVTITSTLEDTIGRTEIMMGTSDAAKAGKLSRSQTGQRDLTLVWIGLGVFVIIVIAIIALMRR
jgi:hypothetical protein